MPRRNIAFMVSALGLLLLALTVGLTAPMPDKDYLLVKQVAEALAKIDQEYVRALSDEERTELIENMIDGGVRRLDEHSEYMNLERTRQFNKDTEGRFSGIGVTITSDPVTKFLKVESLIPGTPAYEAGLAAGDLITTVNGVSTHNLTVSDARKLIMGEVGTPVTLATRRDGRTPADQDVVVTRGSIEVNPVSGVRRLANDPMQWDFMLDPEAKIGYIRLATFSSEATKKIAAALKQLHEAGAKGLILDLRDDPGGLLPQAIGVADLFLPAGERIVSTRDRAGNEKVTTATGPEAGLEFAEQWPLAVLVNRQSASASEIVAAALQDHERAVIVGERTFGKGSVQKLFELAGPPRASLKLTAETYWRPSGKNIHRDPRTSKDTDDWGVKPNPGYDMPLSDEEYIRFLRHTQDRGLVTGKPGLAPPPKPVEPKKDEKPFEDRTLQKALEYMKAKLAGTGQRKAAPLLPETVQA